MRRFATILALIVSVAYGSEPLKFPFVGTLKIGEATKYWDGGSVTLVLFDAEAQYIVHYRTQEAGEANGGGLLTYRPKTDDKGITFARGSDEEELLLNYIRAACVVSYGTSDPDRLSELDAPKGMGEYFHRSAIGSLLKSFEDKKKPNKAEEPTPNPPSD